MEEMRGTTSPYDNKRDDAVTAGEKYVRDTLISPVARIIWLVWFMPRLLRRFGVSRETAILFGAANALSLLGLILLAKFWLMYRLSGMTQEAFLILIAVFFTDFIDGPVARIHNEITPLGTLLDHLRDYLAFFSALAIVFVSYAEKPDIIILLALTVTTTAVLIAANIKMFLARREVFKHHRDFFSVIRDSSLEDYQTSFTGRLHFFSAAVGTSGLLLFIIAGREWIYFLAYAILLVHLTVSGFYIYEVWNNYYRRLAVFERWRRRTERIKTKIHAMRRQS